VAENQAGNEAGSGGDPAKPESLQPAPDSRSSDSTDYKKLTEQLKQELLAQKPKIEEANRILAERDAAPPPAATAPGGDAYWADIEKGAAAGDYACMGALALKKQREEDRRDIADALQIQAITDEAERNEVATLYLQQRNRFGDVDVARRVNREGKLAADNEKLRDALKLAQVNKPDPNVVRTDTREVTASQSKASTMTNTEWQARQARLKTEGNYSEMYADQLQRRKGKLKVEG